MFGNFGGFDDDDDFFGPPKSMLGLMDHRGGFGSNPHAQRNSSENRRQRTDCQQLSRRSAERDPF